jgi:hypothetical protein
VAFLAALEAPSAFCRSGFGRRAFDGGSVDFGAIDGIDGCPHFAVVAHPHKGEDVAVPVDDVDIDHFIHAL